MRLNSTINNQGSFVEEEPLKFSALLLFCLFVVFSSTGVFAQTFPTSCTSKDLTLLKASLPAPTTNACQCDGARKLVLGIRNGTGSFRTSFAMWGTLVRTDANNNEVERVSIFACASGIQAKSDNFLNATTIRINGVDAPTASIDGLTLPVISLSCGQSLDIVDIHLAWTSANANETCDMLYNNPSTINPKCGVQDLIHVDIGVDAKITTAKATCSGNGSLTVAPTGGTATTQNPYKVTVNGGSERSVAPGASTTYSLPSGTYTVVITDSKGCTATRTPTIGSTSAPSVTGIGGDFTKTCTSNTSGKTIGETPVSGFTYSWSPSAGLSDATIGNPTANPSSTTKYTVTKTETATGCQSTKDVTVTVNTTLPSVTGIGGDFTKTCTSNTSGKTIGETPVSGFTYSWSPSAGLSDATIGNPTANPSSTTKYTVTKTETATGCQSTKDVTVTVNTTLPSVTGIGGDFTKTCTSNTSGKTIGETPVSGFTYSWSPSAGLSDATIGNPTANPSSTTKYTVTKTETATGCQSTKDVTVTVNTTLPSVTGIGGDFTKTCTSNTSGKTIGETPVSGFTYSWSPSAGLSDATIGNPTANPSSTTKYTVTKTETATGCQSTKDVTVTVNTDAPTFTVCIVQPTLCSNSGSVTFDASGGSGFAYSINNGTSYQTDNTFAGLASGSVSGYKVKNSYGCLTTVSCEQVTISCPQTGAAIRRQSSVTNQEISLNSEPKTNVLASPNPFNDRIRFTLKSNVTGQGSLELYNMLGQKLKTVFSGYVKANEAQTIEYAVPYAQRANMIYLFRVGTEKTSGKLVGLK